MNTLFAIEQRHSGFTLRNGLPRAHRNTGSFLALFTQLRIAENNMIRKAWGRLHFSAHQQRVLMRNQQLAVVFNLWPAAGIHDCVMQWPPARCGRASCGLQLLRLQTWGVELLQRVNLLVCWSYFGAHRELAI